MADSFTAFLNLTKPEVGGSTNTWGTKLDGNMDAIDTWASATDALAKRALLKDTGNQQLPGDLTLTAGSFITSKGAGLTAGASVFKDSVDGNGADYSTDVIASSANTFRVVNNANNAELLRLDSAAGTLKVFNSPVLTQANTNFTKFLDLTAIAAQIMNGPLVISNSVPYIDFLLPGTIRWRQVVDGASNLIFRNGDNNQNYLYIGTSGAVWTAQLGDLNTRIEARAAAYADDRLNTATARINNKSARLSYVADKPTGDGETSIVEPYAGSVMTGYAMSGARAGYVAYFRFRQLQMSDSNGNWYACGYIGP